ncbi:MAG: flagellar hook-length control protein FliK [Pseudomonadota bacterium]
MIASLSKDSWPKSHAIKVEHETVVSAGDTPEEPRKEIEPIMFQTPRPQALYASSKLGDEAPAQISGHAAGNSWGNSHQDQELFTRLNGSTEPKPLADVMTLTEPAAPTQRSGTEPAATSAAALNPVGKTLAELLTQQGTHPTATIASAVKTNQITRPDGSVVKTLRLQLNPAEMGMLNVSLKLIGDQMQVEVRAEKAIAHQSILQDQEALVAALRSAGIRLDTIVVSGPQAAAAPERLPGSDSGSSAGAGLAQSGAGNPDHKQRQLQHNGGFDFNYGDQSDKAVEPQPSTVRSHGLAVI